LNGFAGFVIRPAANTKAVRDIMDIDDDYYTARPPDPDYEEFDDLVDRIRNLCGERTK
jgi:hypothetical protein